jgi:hypothetical protein
MYSEVPPFRFPLAAATGITLSCPASTGNAASNLMLLSVGMAVDDWYVPYHKGGVGGHYGT